MDLNLLYPFVLLLFSCFIPAWSYRKPHIIFIVADDLGWNDVGWRNPEIKTPNLDRLAKYGVILNSSYVSPTCSPSRNSMLTGIYPHRVGLQNSLLPTDTRHLPDSVPTLPERLKKMGYSTHMIGKWHLGFCDWKHTPTQRGFDSFMGFFNGGQDYYKHTKDQGYDFWLNNTVYRPPKHEYSTKTYTRRATQLFQEHTRRKGKRDPMFLYLSYQSVHTPLQVPKKYERLYKHISNTDRRTFNGMVTAMDQSVGTIVSALRKYKMLRNSIIVFTTDNGGAAHLVGSNLPLRGSKTTLWEGGTRGVGFVYSSRIFKRNYEHNGLFHAVDWVPTLITAAGGKADKRLDGINQWSMIRGGKPSKRKEFVYSIGSKASAIRVGDYKLIVGNPGLYNRWFKIPKRKPVCSVYSDEHEEGDDDIFLYENLNNMARNVKTYLSWLGTKLPGYNYWKQIQRLKAEQKCKEVEKKERKQWIFPKFLLYNIKDDPIEKHNIAGRKPILVRKLNARLHRHQRRAKLDEKIKSINPKAAIVDGVWFPGWC